MRFPSFIILLALLVTPGLSQAETLAQAVEKCRIVSNSLKRLVCYDKLAQRANNLEDSDLVEFYAQRPIAQTPPGGQTRPGVPQRTPSQSSSPESDFGLEMQKQQQKNEDTSEITAVVGKVEKAPKGKLIITLEDGQVWRQTDGGDYRLKSGDTIIISRGAIGSFYLKKYDANKRIRVKRSK